MNTYHKTLTDEEVLNIYSKYSWLYRLHTRKNLADTTIAEALKEFTFDDMFMEYINQISSDWTQDENNYWEDNMAKFDFINYFVPDEKILTEKTWIKVRTENGYEIHLASRSVRKRRWDELLSVLYKKASTINKQIIKRLEAGITDNEKLESKTKDLENQIIEMRIRKSIYIKPYEVKIRRTKTRFEYLLPYQYEIIDVEETVDYYLGGIKQITIKSFFNSDNNDKIFYLRTRGIPEKIAIVLSSLKDCYFKVDIRAMFQEYNQQIRDSFQIIEK